ncbi:coiled-coil domain-containing protein 186 isoform X2 [Halyomorpha halys]|uniref:coiled-coil domain-containing protein 186 isoform X2 n=1 Tax=Halyomorpha halys TaxID=286706 RepID=UPI0006D51D9F|nr:coiled-coil domain-containing protein 186-like isoform X2 [Halyomorpha halys]
MAFQVQETTSEKERTKIEWGSTDNDLSSPPAVDIELNENLNDNLNYSHQVVEFIKPKVDSISDHASISLHLGEESTCVGKKDEENSVCNGEGFGNLEPSEIDNRGGQIDCIQLNATKDILVNMKIPSVSLKENEECTIDSNMNTDSNVIPIQSMNIQTLESLKVGGLDKINHDIQLDETKNMLVNAKFAPVLINGSQDFTIDSDSKNIPRQPMDFQNPELNQVDGCVDKNGTIHLNETNDTFSHTGLEPLSINENHTIDSGLNFDSKINPKDPMDFQSLESYKIDNLGEINNTDAVSDTTNIYPNVELPSASVKEIIDCTVNSNLDIGSEIIPNRFSIGSTPYVCHLTDYPNLHEFVDRHFENLSSGNADEESPPETGNNFMTTLSGVDFQKISEDSGERESSMSSESISQNSIDSDETTETTSINNKDNVEEIFSDHNCLLHPAYVQALTEINGKDQEISELDKTIERLKEVLSEETSKSERISELEQLLSQHEKELLLMRKEQEIDKQSFTLVKKELENKCAILKKDIEMANRDKENMVMRYAVSEKELIDIKKEKETLLKKLKDTGKENESLLDRMKNLVNDKSKLSQLLDVKTTDLSTAHKEIDRLREEINARDIKIKWTQNKLKTEMESHKEYPSQIDRLMIRVRCLEEDLSNAKTESQNLKKQLEESEQSKVLESQLKEQQAKLIMERYEHSEIETKYKSLQTRYQSMIEENNSLSFQVQNLETERLELEKKLSSSREDTEKLSNTVSELQSKLVELDSLNSQLKQSEDKVDTLMSEMERVRHQNEELLQDMSACRARESEMLSFTQKLTTKNVQLQSEFSTLESKAVTLEKKDERSRTELKELKEKLNEVQSELLKEKLKREEETHLLARQIAEKTKKSEVFEVDLADTKANLTQSKLKHATVVKVCDVSKEILVERILKLQSEAAKSAEKIEFLEDHTAQLLAEVQKQSRLLQSYMLREEAGALAPSFLDNHKAEVSKHGGIMASLYSSTQQDEGMSLELSLEINRKLQAVLEDTLLKNIMLKENLDTLGDEIVRLKEKK